MNILHTRIIFKTLQAVKCHLVFNFKRGLVQVSYHLRSFNLKLVVDLYVPFDYLILSYNVIAVLFKLNFNCSLLKKALKVKIVASLLKNF